MIKEIFRQVFIAATPMAEFVKAYSLQAPLYARLFAVGFVVLASMWWFL